MKIDKKYRYFQEEYKFEYRKKEFLKIKNKYPERIPVIVEKNIKCDDLINIKKKKYLVPNELNISSLIYLIRKNIKLDSSKALFLMTNNKILNNNKSLYDAYEENKSEDGFLYIYYTSENTLG